MNPSVFLLTLSDFISISMRNPQMYLFWLESYQAYDLSVSGSYVCSSLAVQIVENYE